MKVTTCSNCGRDVDVETYIDNFLKNNIKIELQVAVAILQHKPIKIGKHEIFDKETGHMLNKALEKYGDKIRSVLFDDSNSTDTCYKCHQKYLTCWNCKRHSVNILHYINELSALGFTCNKELAITMILRPGPNNIEWINTTLLNKIRTQKLFYNCIACLK